MDGVVVLDPSGDEPEHGGGVTVVPHRVVQEAGGAALGRPSPVFGMGSGRRTRSLPERRRDPREDGASRARGEAGRRGSRAREDGVRRRAADGAGGRGGRGRREEPAPGPTRGRALAARGGAAQRPPRAAPGDARGPDRARGPARLGKGGRPPSLLEPRRTAEKALVAVIREAHRHGVPTRAVDGLVRAMGGGGVSRSRSPPRTRSGVSRLRAEIDERVRAFLERRIEGRWPSLRLDAAPALAGAGSASSSARTAASRAAPPWWPPR